MKNVDFYFDFLSPYSYFAWINHKKLKAQFDLEFHYKPVLMGRLFSHFEFKGPGEILVKRNYELKKCFRYAQKNNIQFSPPKTFPFNPMAVIRVALESVAKDKQFDVIDLFFKKVWGESTLLEDPEVIQKILEQSNFDTDLLEKSFEREAKSELKQNIKEAIARNIFGVPSMYINEELFWGNDSLSDLENYLTGNDNWNEDLYNELVEK